MPLKKKAAKKVMKKNSGDWKVYEPDGFPKFTDAGSLHDKKMEAIERKMTGIKSGVGSLHDKKMEALGRMAGDIKNKKGK